MALGARLKEFRIKKNQSLQQVADAVQASKAHIWDLETGRANNPSMDLLNKLASHFGTSVSTLVGEDPSASSEDPALVAMFRDLKSLTAEDRDRIHRIMKSLKEPPDK